MLFKNPDSKRENPFRETYDNEKFKMILQHKNDLPDFPFLIDIELTNHCNLNCIFCNQQTMTRDKGFMSEEVFKKVVDECTLHKTPIRFIRWGEPFLHPNVINFCQYVKSKELILHITNNGLEIQENDMKALINLEVDSVIFSFQGATKERYELMRNNYRYDKLRTRILKLVELRGNREKPFIHISSTMTTESKEEIDNFISYWVHIVDSVGVGKTNLSRVSDKFKYLQKQETIEKKYSPCTEVYQKLSVDWDGKVSCCCGDFDNFLTVGNINESTLFDIWNNNRELRIIRELLDKNLHKSLTLCSTCFPIYEHIKQWLSKDEDLCQTKPRPGENGTKK